MPVLKIVVAYLTVSIHFYLKQRNLPLLFDSPFLFASYPIVLSFPSSPSPFWFSVSAAHSARLHAICLWSLVGQRACADSTSASPGTVREPGVGSVTTAGGSWETPRTPGSAAWQP